MKRMTKKQQKALYEEMLPLIQEYRELAKLGEQYKKEVALHKQKSTKTNEMTQTLYHIERTNDNDNKNG